MELKGSGNEGMITIKFHLVEAWCACTSLQLQLILRKKEKNSLKCCLKNNRKDCMGTGGTVHIEGQELLYKDSSNKYG